MKQSNYYLYLEPYVTISTYSNSALLYNTLNKKKLIYKSDEVILNLIRKLNEYNYVLLIDNKLLKMSNVNSFVSKLKKYYFGDLTRNSTTDRKPFVFKPIVSIQKNTSILRYDKKLIGYSTLLDLKEITFYLNSHVRSKNVLFKNAYKQFPCLLNNDSPEELSFDLIKAELDRIKEGSLNTINIYGGSILEYCNLEKLINYLNKLPQVKKYHIHFNELENANIIFNLMDESSIVNTILETESLAHLNGLQLKVPKKTRFQFIVSKESDLLLINEIRKNTPLISLSITPYISGKNMTFIKSNVFIKMSSLLKCSPSQSEVFQNQEVNMYNFGKVTVINTGYVYSNVNSFPLGRLGEAKIGNMLQKELKTKHSWFLLRKSVSPCKECIYNILCPPISNYEVYLKKYNFCTII